MSGSSPHRGRVGIRALVIGVGLVIVYLALAAMSGRLSPLARRPLLDGFAPPPKYRWVSPPPDLAGSNQRPTGGSFGLALNPQRGSEANVLNTADIQVSLAMPSGAFPPRPGKDTIKIDIQPLAPPPHPVLPTGLTISGNVYRIAAAYSPGGPAVDRLQQAGQLTMFYPAAPNTLLYKHHVLFSADGRTWRAVTTTDSPSQQQASAAIRQLGSYAVGQSGTGTRKPANVGRIVYYVVLGGLASALVVVFVVTEVRLRRRRATKRGTRNR